MSRPKEGAFFWGIYGALKGLAFFFFFQALGS